MTKYQEKQPKDCKVIDFNKRIKDMEVKRKEEIRRAIIKNIIESGKSF